MAVKVAINGFGRIGRALFRQMIVDKDIDIVALNGVRDINQAANLIKYDSTLGRFEHYRAVEAKEDSIAVYGKEIKVFNARGAEELPWAEVGADIVMDCSGAYRSKEAAMVHINAGAKKVIISTPAGAEVPVAVYGVNERKLTENDNIISTSSCTMNALAPMVKALNDYVPVLSGMLTSVHAFTQDQKTLDAPHRKDDFRRARTAATNIVPNDSMAAYHIGMVIPELDGKLDGLAQRVPVADGSTAILVALVEGNDVTVDKVNAVMKAAENASFGYNSDPIVSSDIVGTTEGGIFDATQTMVASAGEGLYQVQVVSWYDNEYGYAAQMHRVAKHVAGLL